MDWRLGTCGFGYSDWSGVFYPRGLKGTDQLSFYAQYFNTVELDTTFHAVPPPEIVRRWAGATPADFRFCAKAPKTVTHGPSSPHEQIAPMLEFLDTLRELEDKLGVILLQFPRTFMFEQFDGLRLLLKQIPTDVRIAVEFRHESWLRDSTTHMLRDHNCCWAVGDYAIDPAPVRVTTDFLYIRWIGIHGTFPQHQREQVDVSERLQWWQKSLQSVPPRVQTVWGYMNNDYAGYSPATANRLKRLLGIPAREPAPIERGELFG